MRILFLLTSTSFLRHFDSVLLTLADRGHSITLATPKEQDWPLPPAIALDTRISRLICPAGRADAWNDAATHFRLLVDCARYLDDPFRGAGKLRTRALRTFIRTLTDDEQRQLAVRTESGEIQAIDEGPFEPVIGGKGAARMKTLLRLIEDAIPSDPGRECFLAAASPDVVLVSPLVELGSDQPDWVKSARSLGIPVGFPVFSWDNLTTKGVLHVQPDRLFVWNAIQQREAVDYLGVDAAQVVVTGAPRFDAFFAMTPQLCQEHGLDPAHPIITYLCSSDFVSDGEVKFVEGWIRKIRRDPGLASCNVLVRPHPRSVRQWSGVDVAAWGRTGLALSRVLNADQLLYDVLFHSAAVVGLNTSAQIEAGIVGTPVCTLLRPRFERGQQQTVHFHYLLRRNGGFVDVAADLSEHRQHLVDAIAGRTDRDAAQRFIERFVRPAGLDRPAAPLLADAIEEFAAAHRPALRQARVG
jgi:hypothetical protein